MRMCYYSSDLYTSSEELETTTVIGNIVNYYERQPMTTVSRFDQTACYRDTLRPLLRLMRIQGLTEIVNATRIMELIGLTISLISLVVSLVIFHKYRVLRNNRTKIHKNLFTAILLQVVFRLLQYVDQWVPFVDPYTTEYLCIGEVILLEFGKIAMIIWMFIEGLYLHNAITLTIFQEHSKVRYYFYCGWAAALIFTTLWVVSMRFVNTDVCWFLYQFEPNYWILEGPSSAILIINILFLLNIIRILVAKLRQTRTGELSQLMKAVKAATFLVPLMGITNALFLVSFSVFDQLTTFAIWTFVTYFLASFQGCIISVLYCFLNGEVKTAVKNSISVYYCQLYLKTGTDQSRHCGQNKISSLEETGLTTLDLTRDT